VTPANALRLGLRSLARHRARTALLVSGILIGVTFITLLLALVRGLQTAVVDRLVGSLPVTHLQVGTRQYAMGALQFDNPFAKLDSAAVARVRALPGVREVLPMAALTTAAQLRASFFGQDFVTDAAVFGIEPGLLEGDLAGRPFERVAAGPVPAVISRDIVDMYNTGFAGANDLPKLNESILLNQDGVLTIGSSSLRPAGFDSRIERVPVRIVGVSSRVPVAGISVPIGYVQEWNRRFGGERAAGEFVGLTVVAADAREVEGLAKRLEAMGLQVNTGRELAQKVAAIARTLSLAFGLVGAVILLVAGLGIANALALSVMERQREIGIYRSVGASRGNIRTLFLLEALALGVLGSGAGVALALALERLIDRAILKSLPDLSLAPPTFFVNTWQIVGLAFIMGIAVSVLAGVPPAARAARLQPAEVLKGA
jgi:ABC-type lipoprotein release transport system permease subunit